VLAYAQPPPAVAQGSASARCAVPNRGIRVKSFWGNVKMSHTKSFQGNVKTSPADPPSMDREIPSAAAVVSRFGAAHVMTFDLTVDARGVPRKVVVVGGPRYPSTIAGLKVMAMHNRYEPALHDCVPVAATIRTGVDLGQIHLSSYSIVTPAYPDGWSAQHPSSCKVPTLQHSGDPAFPVAMENAPIGVVYQASVRVHVGAAGTATNAAIVRSSGHADFDAALLAAARQVKYPLTEMTGFKQARPSNATLEWNATHGSDTYLNCKPLPADYVWNTTFERQVSMFGQLGTMFMRRAPSR
jgi:TonB family protein